MLLNQRIVFKMAISNADWVKESPSNHVEGAPEHACGEVRCGDVLHEFGDGDVRRVYESMQAGHDLPQVMRRYLCGYAHRNARRTVHE